MAKTGLKYYSGVLLKGTAAVSLANASTRLVSLLLLPVFTYYLSPEDYGIVAMFSIVVNVLALIYNPGMMSATMRLYHATNEEEDRKTLIGSAHRFFLFIPVIPIILGLLFGERVFAFLFSDFDFYPYGFLALILAFFVQPKRIWTTLMTLKYKIHVTAFYSALSFIFDLLITLLFVVALKMGALGKVFGMFPGALFLFAISIVAVRKYTKGRGSFRNMRKQLLFGLPLIIALWSYEVLHIAGKFLLERMTDLHSVGLYAFGIAIAQMPMFLVLGAKQLWNPIFYENMNKKDYKTVSQLVTYFIAGLTIINLIVILFNKELILLLVNERFYDSIPIIGFIVLGIHFNGLLTISNSLLGFKNQYSTISKFAVIASVLNVALNVFLIPRIGVLGAALSIAVAYFVFFMLGILHQRATLKLIQNKGVTLVPIIAITAATLFIYILNSMFAVSKPNPYELTAKIIFFVFVILIFFKTNILRTKEFYYIYYITKNQFQKRI